MEHPLSRRQVLASLSAAAAASVLPTSLLGAKDTQSFQIAPFTTDITPPLGHPLIGGWRAPAKKILDRLRACGVVLLGGEQPLVILSLDWCEIRNAAYDHFREAVAKAAGTTRERVLLTCVHQHDAPYVDSGAAQALTEVGLKDALYDEAFFEKTVQAVAEDVRDALKHPQPITHLGHGEAEVEGVACNRRVELPGQPPSFSRSSFTRDEAIKNAPEGLIDPFLKTISFWNNDQPVAALHCYATHPMSYYGRGEVSHDFVGMAREQRQRDDADVFQMYLTGCSGDITAAKFNSGDYDGRVELANQLHQGMVDAWKATKRTPLTQLNFRLGKLDLEPLTIGNLAPEALQKILKNKEASYVQRSRAALGISWQARYATGQPIDLPVIDFGPASIVLLPAEAFVAFGLAAQKMRPDQMIMAVGFGESAPGYIPTAQNRKEGFVKHHGYTWTAPGTEERILQGLESVLKK